MFGQQIEIKVIELGGVIKRKVTGKLIHICQGTYDGKACPIYIVETQDTIEQIFGYEQFGKVEISKVKENLADTIPAPPKLPIPPEPQLSSEDLRN